MSVNYVKVEQSRITTENPPRPRLTALGYTVRAGSPTVYMARLEGERIFRRVYAWQFSNAGALFVRIKGQPHVLSNPGVLR